MADKISTLQKVVGKAQYQTTLGEDNDLVKIGDEKSASFVPQITFTNWNKENSLTIKPSGQLAIDLANATPTLSAGKLEIRKGDIGWYANPDPDNSGNFKFGLILYEKPTTNTWTFKLENWEEYNFFRQPPLTEEWKVGDKCSGGIIAKVTETECLDSNGKTIIKRPEKIVNGYVVSHKTKRDYIEGQTNYRDGLCFTIHRVRLLDADGLFVGYADLQIKDGDYILTVDQKILDTAKKPIKFNDEFGNHPSGTPPTGYTTGSTSIGYAIAYQTTCPAEGALGSIFVAGYSEGVQTLRSRLYSDSGTDPQTKLSEGTKSLGAWDDNGGTFWHELIQSAYNVAITTYWLTFRPDSDTFDFYYISTGGIHRFMNGANWADPWDTVHDVPGTQKIAIYATYTAGGGAANYRAKKGKISGYHCFIGQYMKFTNDGLAPLKLPDGTLW